MGTREVMKTWAEKAAWCTESREEDWMQMCGEGEYAILNHQLGLEPTGTQNDVSLDATKDGDDFFGQAYVDAFTYCYEPDRQRFQEQVTAENVLKEIRQHGSFGIDYHLIIKGVPRPVTLKAAMFKDGDEEKMVVGVREWKARKE